MGKKAFLKTESIFAMDEEDYQNQEWRDFLCPENESAAAKLVASVDPDSMDILPKENATQKLINNIVADETFEKITIPVTPESQELFKKLQENPQENASITNKTSAFAYYHTRTLLLRYDFKRIETDIYVYQQDLGCYKLLNENNLKTLIRKGFDENIQCRLSKFEVSDIVERLQTEPTICVDADYFDPNRYLVNFLNGTLDVRSGVLSQHSQRFRLTTLIHADYDPKYKLEGSLFAEYLGAVSENDPKKVSHLQEISGYNLSSLTNVKKATVFDGAKDSGKSTYIRVMQFLVGIDNVSFFSLSALGQRFALGKALTKRLNVFGERGSQAIKDVECFKSLTGGDWHETENKGADFVSRPAACKYVFAGNSLPSFENADDSDAFMERITLYIFSHTIDEGLRIKDMDMRLLEERNLIASWAMDGLMRLVDNNCIFHEAEDAIIMRRSKKSQVNIIEDFINENCDLRIGARVFSKDLYECYRRYCHLNAFESLRQAEFVSEVIAKSERKGPVHKKIRIAKKGPYFGFENLGLKEKMPVGTDGTTEHFV